MTSERNEETEGVQHRDHQAKAAETEESCSDLGDKDTGPKQLKLSQYPHTQFGTQKRAFQEQWFKSFRWLEYSARQNAAFLVGYLAKMSERMHLLMMELITGKRHLASFKNMKQHSHIRTVWFVGTATKQACQKGML